MLESKVTSLFLLTAFNKATKEENIIFANFKEELSTSIENSLISKIKLYEDNDNIYNQRFYVFEKNKLRENFQNLKNEKKLDILNELFILNCRLDPVSKKNDINKINGYEKSEKYITDEYLYEDCENLEDTNFIYLYEHFSKSIKSNNIALEIFPNGYISEENLNLFLKNKVCLRYEKLFFIETAKGDEENKDLEPLNYVGEVFYAPIDLEFLQVSIISNRDTDISTVDSLNWQPIDRNTGKWKYTLDKRSAKGIIMYRDSRDNKILTAEKFSLIMSHKININILDTNIKDLYDDDIIYSNDARVDSFINNKIEDKYYLKNSYSEHTELEYSKEISRYIETILESLGDTIYFVDPYLLGKIVDNKLNISQAAFINAIFKVLTKINIKKIAFVCCHLKVKRSKIYSEENYNNLILDMKKINPDLEVEIIQSKKIFHDRYIVGFNTYKVISVSGSINGLINNDEFSFKVLDKNDSKKMIKYINELIQL